MSTKKIQILGSLNADTLDGKHAEEFALVSDIETLVEDVIAKKTQVQIITWEADD